MYDELTQVDIDKMKAELEDRRLNIRPKIMEDVKTARAFGDLSENYEYKAATEAQRRNDSRMRYLERMIATAKVVDVKKPAADTVGLFSTVTLFNEKLGREQTIRIVTTILLYKTIGETALNNAWHEGLGYAQVVLTVALFFLVGCLLPENEEPSAASSSNAAKSASGTSSGKGDEKRKCGGKKNRGKAGGRA